jgi:SAM-dependent methyltransferase
MPLAYYSVAAGREFWTEHWQSHALEQLLQVARLSPLTDLIFDALPGRGRVLEAGCGLGQYVLLLGERGYRAVGVDEVFDALRECRKRAPAAPLTVMDLHALGFRAATFAAYISLGVVEHDPAGPGAILGEARRVLEPGGVLILSVPYVNGLRRIGAWWIRRQNRQIRSAGGQFYQFAFSQPEARTILDENGFRVLRFRPYDPARVLRRWARRTRRRLRLANPGNPPAPDRPERPVPRSALARSLRRLLYTGPMLRFFGHMILAVAVKR